MKSLSTKRALQFHVHRNTDGMQKVQYVVRDDIKRIEEAQNRYAEGGGQHEPSYMCQDPRVNSPYALETGMKIAKKKF